MKGELNEDVTYMLGVLNKMFDPNKRDLKRLEKIADRVEELATEMEQLSDEQLKAKTAEFQDGLRMVKRSRIFSRKRLRSSVKLLDVYLACIRSVYKLLVRLRCMKVISQR